MIELSDVNFVDETMYPGKEKVSFIDFYSPLCIPCRSILPVLERLEEEYKDDVDFYKMDATVSPVTSSKYEINMLPTFIVIYQGNVVEAIYGTKTFDEFCEILEEFFNSDKFLISKSEF